MSDDSSDYQHRRRTFLKSIGAVGASAAVGPAAAARGTSESLDDYHRTLRNDLTASSRQQRQLPPGSYVYGTTEEAALDAFSLRGAGAETTVPVDTDAVPITKADRVRVPTAWGDDHEADDDDRDDDRGDQTDPSASAYAGEITDRSFAEGDLLLAVAYLRSDEDAEVKARFGYRYTDARGNPAFGENFVQRSARVEPGERWMRYFFPVEVGAEPDGSDLVPALEFLPGSDDWTVEFGGLALFDYGDADVSLGTLPPYDYEGRAEDAEWRQAARERIEKVRKTDVEVEVLNPGGKPMADATVEVEMTDHAFDFGSAVSVGHITGDGEDDETYRETFRENFNKATVENGLKYPAWEGEWDIDNDATRATLDWFNERDVPVRGHYLLWEQFDTAGGGGMSIENADSLSGDELRRRITEKIRTHATEFADDVVEWDMHNHPVWQSNFRDDDGDGLGWDDVRHWWDVANAATEDGLYTNEMGVVGGTWQQDAYYDYLTRLVENDYPVDGIAFMGHHQQQWNQILDVDTLISSFERFAEFDLPLLVSEFDIQIFSRRNAQDVELQRDYTRDFLTVAFSQAAVEGVVSWGFWADDHWRPTGAYYDSDWTLRPHGETYRDLVFDEWWTDETGETDDNGVYATRGFKGDYRIAAEKGALSGETTVTIDDETDTVTVELAPAGRDESRGDGEDGEDDESKR
ncbi:MULTISPECIES: endo-1,4-beta-xylanase [Halorussus]|uniref:endo-1,4-beta-xylanase n=1 Tax=Halorussus TaxID=1070314 RepID=UPI00209DCE45|nr:endo-1,4-beta-xylanase [Halorussus vallis]USZ78391.1 endo-1,4-beta-xylanase [Halorussus vallis]